MKWLQTLRKQNTRFKLHSFNPDVFFDVDFLPYEVTNRPQRSLNEDPTGETNKELQIPMSTEKDAAENNTCANSLVKKSPSEGDEEEPERASISPFQHLFYPESKNNRQKEEDSWAVRDNDVFSIYKFTLGHK
jgi:hypothetical protein